MERIKSAAAMKLGLIGSSAVMRALHKALARAAKCDKSVLILGETGTGKDLAAKRIHELSRRRTNPFVPINCANLPEGLFESELFGHTLGAFTGAIHERSGLLEIADNGTIFMDEVGELPLALQAKMLRLLDKRESRRLGSNTTNRITARFIFATNRDLFNDVEEGRFRKDLYYRINVVCIKIPALRERQEDIVELARHFISRENRRLGTDLVATCGAIQLLRTHNYPGNVRELENIIERTIALSEHNRIRAEDIRFDQESCPSCGKEFREKLENTLARCHWNKTRASLELGISRRQLYRILKRNGVNDCFRRALLLG